MPNPKNYNASPHYNDSVRFWLLMIFSATTVAACGPVTQDQPAWALYIFRQDRQALVRSGEGQQPGVETPIPVPQGCTMAAIFAPPVGHNLALEFSCAFGPATLILDRETGKIMQPVRDADSHFLAWATDGSAVYLRISSINQPRIVEQYLDGRRQTLPISELTYDLAPSPSGHGFLFSLSAGLGQGSETWIAGPSGSPIRQLFAEPLAYNALVRWSPDGSHIAWIKIPDSSTAFTVGDLWVAGSDGSDARAMARADAGHGFAPAWSPDGSQVAFVFRENAGDAAADQSSSALESNLHLVDVNTGTERASTDFQSTMVQAPVWQPMGGKIAFIANADDTMTAYILDIAQGGVDPVLSGPVCCPVWLRQ